MMDRDRYLTSGLRPTRRRLDTSLTKVDLETERKSAARRIHERARYLA